MFAMQKNSRSASNKKYCLIAIAFFFLAIAEAQEKQEEHNAAADYRTAIVNEAQKCLGRPYRRGAMGPNAFDCSGFVYYVVRKAAGVQLPRTSYGIKSKSHILSEGKLLPGDLLFFTAASKGKISHVGIYIGKGQFIHAASDGPKTGVITSSIMDNYWKKHYDCAGRVIEDDT